MRRQILAGTAALTLALAGAACGGGDDGAEVRDLGGDGESVSGTGTGSGSGTHSGSGSGSGSGTHSGSGSGSETVTDGATEAD